MTLLVRNEVDVVEGNIRFHLDHGVDFIVATDNGSTDGTREILEKYQQQGVLHLIDEPSRVFEQEKWVNRMGVLARESYGAEAVFHADADELWYPHSGSLKNEFGFRRRVDVLYVPVSNLLLQDRQGAEQFPQDVAYRVRKPWRKPLATVKQEADQTSLLLYRQPDKVFCTTRHGYLDVVQGNHHVQRPEGLCQKPSWDIDILHVPVRGREQFFKKALNNGEGIANLAREQALPDDKAWHVRRWSRLQEEGRLDEEYQRLRVSGDKLAALLDSGRIGLLEARYQHVLDYYR